jgi:hypothetical protein
MRCAGTAAFDVVPAPAGNFVPRETVGAARGTLLPSSGRFVPRGTSETARGTLFPGPIATGFATHP